MEKSGDDCPPVYTLSSDSSQSSSNCCIIESPIVDLPLPNVNMSEIDFSKMDIKSDVDNLLPEKQPELKSLVCNRDISKYPRKCMPTKQGNINETAEQKGNINMSTKQKENVNENQTVEDYSDVQSVLFISHNNKCRGPMAEAIAINYIMRYLDQKKWAVKSASISGRYVGEKIDIRASKVLMQHSIYNNHVTREVTQKDLQLYKYILCIDRLAFNCLKTILPRGFDESKIKLMAEMNPHRSLDQFETLQHTIMDNEEEFQELFKVLRIAVTNFLAPFRKPRVVYP